MSKKTLTPIAAALGTTFVVSLATSPVLQAGENPFTMNQLSSGYMVAGDETEGKCGDKEEGEGKCGDKKEAEGSCGDKKEGEGSCGESKEEKGESEGKCGS